VKSASVRVGDTETFSNRMTVGFPIIGFSMESAMPPIFCQFFHWAVVGGSSAPFNTYCHWTIFRPSRVTQSQ
jgi:hypothetical protein